MRSIDADQARAQFYRLLAEVAEGEAVTITKRGRAVVRLVPVTDQSALLDEKVEAFRRLRRDNRLDGVSIRDLIEEGRR